MMLMLIYMGMALMFSGLSNLLLLMMVMELLSWMFVLMLPSWMALSYLIIQSFFIFVMFMGVSLFPALMLWTLLFKMGVPPFHGWILMLMYYSEIMIFLFMNIIHKVLPIMLLSKMTYTNMLVFWSGLSVLISMTMIMQLSTMFQVVLFSSMIHSIWIMLSAMISFMFFMFYWVFYTMGSVLLLMSEGMKSTSLLIMNQTTVTLLVWLMISGMPPFIIFWLKAELTTWLIVMSLNTLAMTLIVASVLSLSVYYRAAHLAMESSLHRNETQPVLFMSASMASIF